MGLFKYNYVSKSTGVTLPTAYAVIKDIVLNGENGRAIFVIQSSRENTKTFKPIDKVEVKFVWDRKSDIAKVAYETAKTEVLTREEYNLKTNETVIIKEQGLLYGWLDDIVQ